MTGSLYKKQFTEKMNTLEQKGVYVSLYKKQIYRAQSNKKEFTEQMNTLQSKKGYILMGEKLYTLVYARRCARAQGEAEFR